MAAVSDTTRPEVPLVMVWGFAQAVATSPSAAWLAGMASEEARTAMMTTAAMRMPGACPTSGTEGGREPRMGC